MKMFSDDDFCIDEDFLRDAFLCEAAAIGSREATKRLSDENVETDNKSASKKSKDSDATSSNSKDVAALEAEFYASDDFSQYQEVPCSRSSSIVPKDLEESPRNPVSRNETSKSSNNDKCSTPQEATKSSKSSSTRKFPGPAGLLPKLHHNISGAEIGELDKKNASNIEIVPLVSPEVLTDPVKGSAWQEAIKVLNVKPGDDHCPLGKFTLAWVRQRAVARKLPQHKVPFLLVGLRTLDPGSRDPSVTLQDTSGEMRGILHHELWSEYSMQLMPGSVLALRQVGVMSTGPFARHQCLNITANNVVAIFTPGGSQGNTQMINVKPVPREELVREANVPISPAPSSESQSSSLFPTVRASMSLQRSVRSPTLPSQNSVSSFTSPLQCSTPKSSRVSSLTTSMNSGVPKVSVNTPQNRNERLNSSPVMKSVNNSPFLKTCSASNFVSAVSQRNIQETSVTNINRSKESSANILENQAQQQKFTTTKGLFTEKSNPVSNTLQTTNFTQSKISSFAPKTPTLTSQIPYSSEIKSATNEINRASFTPKSSQIIPPSSSNSSNRSTNQNFTPDRQQHPVQGSTSASKSLVGSFVPKNSSVNFQKPILATSTTTQVAKSTLNTSISSPVPTDVTSLLEGLDTDALFGDF